MSMADVRAIACLGFVLWSAGAAAEKRVMTNPAFGCPSAYETSRVLQMRREGLGVDGHVTEEVDKASRNYMSEHKCKFLKKGELVQFEWSNVQKLEPATLGHAVCVRIAGAEECSFTPKNFAEARSTPVQEDAPKVAAAAPNPPPALAANPAGLQSADAPAPARRTANATPAKTAPPAPIPQVADSAEPQVDTPNYGSPPMSRLSSPIIKEQPRSSGRIELSPL